MGPVETFILVGISQITIFILSRSSGHKVSSFDFQHFHDRHTIKSNRYPSIMQDDTIFNYFICGTIIIS